MKHIAKANRKTKSASFSSNWNQCSSNLL